MQHDQRVRVLRDRCPYCHDEIAATPEREACALCAAWHHSACWSEHGGCSACGLQRAPAPGPREATSLVSYGCEQSQDCQEPAALRFGLSVFCTEHARAAYMRRSAWFAGFTLLLALAAVPPLQTPGARSAGLIFLGLAAVFAGIGMFFCRRGCALLLREEPAAELEKEL